MCLKKSKNSDILNRFKKNRLALLGAMMLIILFLVAISADYIAPYGYDDQDLMSALEFPSAEHLFGCDEFGRDIMSRLIYGARISLKVGFISVGIGMIIGVFTGACAGYYGGKIDNIIMRCMDILLSIPSTLLAIAIAASLGPGQVNLMIAVGISSIPGYARIVRSSVFAIRGQEFIEASLAVGSSDMRIIIKHILPNCMGPLLVQGTLGMARAIINTAGLSFIGLGIQPPIPEWGAMLSGGRQYIRDFPHLTLYPGLAIMLTILALNFLGDGLRDALDPKLKR